MFWVFLEVLAALAVAVGIVWWTWPRKGGPASNGAQAAGKDEPPKG